MEDSEVKTQVADIQEQSVAPVTPVEPTATPTVETAVAPAKAEPQETTEKEVTPRVQKRIDQVTSKLYAALDEKKQLAARVKELEERTAPKSEPPAPKESSMFEEDADEGKTELANLKKTVDELHAEHERLARQQRYDAFADYIGEMREKFPTITNEESVHIIEELNKDDVPPEAHGAIEKYYAAHERDVLKVQLQEKETKQERKQAVTEGKTIVTSEHFPDDPVEAAILLKKDPAKYEELAHKAGLRG
jgi:hypothetical protein